MSGSSQKPFAAKPGRHEEPGRRAARVRLRDESGQSLTEFALVAPLLLLVVLALFKFGMTFNNYLTLTDAVRNGARQLAVERGQPNPCQDATTAVTSSATIMSSASVSTNFPAPDTSTCDNLVAGEAAQVFDRSGHLALLSSAATSDRLYPA